MLDLLPFGRDQVIRVALVMALLAGVTAAAFGIGYRASDAVLGDGSAYVQKGHTIAHVNAESGRTDAEAARDLATGRQRLEVVQVRPGEVYVVNNATGEVWRLPTDTLQPGKVDGVPPPAVPAGGVGETPPTQGPQGQTPEAKPRSELVSGGGVAYLHDSESGKLSRLEGQRAEPVTLPARADAVVVDGSGTAWVLSKVDGVLYEVSGTNVRGMQTVAVPNEAARLTLVANHPVVLLPERRSGGVIRVIGSGDGPAELVVGAQPDGALHMARPSEGPPVLVVLQQRDDTLVTVDLKSGEERQLRLEGRSGPRSYGNPVITRDHVYIPDFNRRQIIVVQLKPLRQLRSVPVPGREPSFDVFERDGLVWVNDPYARTLLTFRGDRWTEPDKGEGRGVVDDTPNTPPTTKPPSPTSAATTRAPRPSPSPAPIPPKRVPRVAGLSGAEACNQVTAAGLTCLPPVTKQQPGCKTGEAINSSPAEGSLVPPRSSVTVFVCGPTAVPGPLVGMHVDQACRTVEAAGLVCARRDAGPAPTPAQVGTVAAQNPAAGAQVPNGSTVEVAYYTGIAVPQITGMGPAQACTTLQAYGLGCAPNPGEITWEANVVHAQSIAPGTPVGLGTAVGYVYQPNGPLKLNRWRKAGEQVRYLDVDGGPPGCCWDPQPAIGGAYPASGGVPGLAAVYQFRCTQNCGSASNRMSTSYFYNMNPDALNGQTRWTREGPAFSCFNSPQPGTRPLIGMFNSSLVAWAFAPQDSWEYNAHLGEGYAPNFTICWIWYGVPGFP